MGNSALKPRTASELGIMHGFPPPPEKRPDLTNWSPWTEPVVADADSVYSLRLELPGPREFFQYRINFEGTATNAVQVDSLAITNSPALAAQQKPSVLRPNPPPRASSPRSRSKRAFRPGSWSTSHPKALRRSG